MSTEVVVTLPEDVYRRAASLAQITSRDVAQVVADAAAQSLSRVDEQASAPRSMADLSDQEVLALSDLQLDPDLDRRYLVLLERQRESEIVPEERAELSALLGIYQQGLVRKAEALQEAVRRGLRSPIKG